MTNGGFDMVQTSYDFQRGQQLKEAGCASVLAGAERSTRGWVDSALSVLESFARSRERFTSDDFRAFADGILPDPPHWNSIGALFSSAAKAKIIVHDGYAKARRPSAHARLLYLWRSNLAVEGRTNDFAY